MMNKNNRMARMNACCFFIASFPVVFVVGCGLVPPPTGALPTYQACLLDCLEEEAFLVEDDGEGWFALRGLDSTCDESCEPVLAATNRQGCPLEQPIRDELDEWCSECNGNPFHPEADDCFREYGAPGEGGRQCCYKEGILLLDDQAGSGTRDSVCPAGDEYPNGCCIYSVFGVLGHFLFDVLG